jgi:hypothetical protein
LQKDSWDPAFAGMSGREKFRLKNSEANAPDR